ncbi:phosphoglucosamine mutase [Amphritea pacifica]|uniref:Phosphoglucosamine mutase n=1 Tax=Amphritea pacifica TaxID=2811233 RepID=A0ABS2WD79_9GAMM|nr:phosphoglucosamine mutase [Amphritea pacifica]MBN0989672.1 phosphoglucosamine mutase [Amphritea pacifica]MBN1008993.1 phosphoglucosamine mutase [Amphritea pacifica]
MTKRYFGTDGIRGKVGTAPITPDFMLKLGWAAGKVFARKGRSKIIIGKDTRISGYMFESALEAGLSAAGVDVLLLGPMPTPAIAYLTRTFRCNAGIVISASHNPYDDNGIKFFSELGTKLPDDIEHAIEAQMDMAMTTVEAAALGKARRIDDAAGRYIEFCKGTVSGDLSLKDMKIVVDCANGATYHIAPKVFRELGATVVEVGASPDGININEECGATATALLEKTVIATQADLGVALDGDGDRLIMVDHKGESVDGDELLFIIAMSLHRRDQLKGGVVGTLMSNFGLEQGLKQAGIPFIRAQVGDRYVLEQLVANDWLLGGESSGHLVCRQLTSTGDGIVAALQVLKAMTDDQKSLHDLKSGMRKMPQTMINVRLTEKVDLAALPAVQSAVADTEARLGERGRVLLRPSGTEPVVRVMVEGDDEAWVEALCEELAEAVRQAL